MVWSSLFGILGLTVFTGAVLGAATWFFALGIVAPVSGLPFLLGVGAITWAALVGHLVYGLVVAGGLALARKRLG